jgi:sRNA-binding protein
MTQKQETALGAALKSAVQTLSKKKQTELIADHLYGKYPVFKLFRPLAIGIHETLIAELSQFDSTLVVRVLTNHCKKPRYLRSLAKGGKRYDLKGRETSTISDEEKDEARQRYEALSAKAPTPAKVVNSTEAAPANPEQSHNAAE